MKTFPKKVLYPKTYLKKIFTVVKFKDRMGLEFNFVGFQEILQVSYSFLNWDRRVECDNINGNLHFTFAMFLVI